ncbi:rod shape-determining protein RodA [Oxobacter pfennigii]|uniref:rod shape-determining protein RodA n=1 Tax=Oxobacter pfennigii TaxID=36849 RepID=UPI00191C5A82|nr:rod shape-determining protein RodA [Oxobacter pfennigii]
MRNFDFGLVINILLICIIGIVTIASATQAFSGGTNRYFIQQIVWVLFGLCLLVVTTAIDYNTYRMYHKVIYFGNVIMLLLVVLVGKVTNGATSWFGIGSFGIQPSEFMKISMIIMLAKKIEEFEDGINNPGNLFKLFLYAALPLGLIMLQPDLGTAMVLVFIVIGMLFMAGLNLKIFFTGLCAAAVSVLAVWFSPVPILKPYQKDRLLVFLNPENDQLGSGYQIVQSKIAIGSGQLFGMGFGNGIQNEGGFLPESHTDFIFSVLGEEFGFIGALILVALYAYLIFTCFSKAKIAKDKFAQMIAVGISSMFLFQMFQNVGMTIGLMPITGITLPFVSYGGSSMWTSMISIGLILNIGMRRHKINF